MGEFEKNCYKVAVCVMFVLAVLASILAAFGGVLWASFKLGEWLFPAGDLMAALVAIPAAFVMVASAALISGVAATIVRKTKGS